MYYSGKQRESLESMLNRFNRLVQTSGLFAELKRREAFEKPSDKRKRKANESRLKLVRKERKDALYKRDTENKY